MDLIKRLAVSALRLVRAIFRTPAGLTKEDRDDLKLY